MSELASEPSARSELASEQATPSGRRRQRNRRRKAIEFWQELPADDSPRTVVPAVDPTAAIRSLGTAPLPGQGSKPDLFLAAVVHRAAGLATALAAASDLLVTPTDD